MGCSESLPVAESFEEPLLMHIPMLRKDSTAASVPQKLVVRAKLFASSDPYELKTPEGYLFGNGLRVQSLANQLILSDGDNTPIAVCERKLEGIRQTFSIYTPQKVHGGQQTQAKTYKNQPLYKYAYVKRRPCSNQLRVKFQGETKPALTLHRTHQSTKVISYQGRTAAATDEDRWDGSWNSYLLTVRPGIDPCLMVCLCAFADETE